MGFPFLPIVWTVFKKYLAVWWQNKWTIVVSILQVVTLLLLQAFGSLAVGLSPVAVVKLDHGATG